MIKLAILCLLAVVMISAGLLAGRADANATTAPATLSATIIVDTDGDMRASPADKGVQTLVELVSDKQGVFSLLTTDAGSFTFESVPDGEYELWVWWGPGFVNVAAADTNAGLARIQLSVQGGNLKAALPAVMLVKASGTGAVPFPVRAGGGGQALPVGTLNVSAELGRTAPSAPPVRALPGTGTGAPPSSWHWLVIAGALALLALPAASVVAATRRKR
jgi:hypothetical protein